MFSIKEFREYAMELQNAKEVVLSNWIELTETDFIMLRNE